MRTSTRPFFGPGTEPLDQQQVLVGIDADDLQAALRDALVAHLARAADAFITRAGQADAPMEPGARTLWEPWVTGRG